MSKLRVVIDSSLDAVPAAGTAVRDLCVREGVAEDDAAMIELAVVEALTNSIRHACSGAPGTSIEIRVDVGSDAIQAEILDEGAATDPRVFAAREPAELDPADRGSLPEGGFGLGILHSVFDRVLFDRKDARNHLTLIRRRRTSEEPFYFRRFEHRRPPAPLPMPASREFAWQVLASMNLVLGGWYIGWRWMHSLNFDALWLSIPLVIAETGSFIGLVLFTFNLWKQEDTPLPDAPRTVADVADHPAEIDRPISVDVFFPTYSEDPELVRLSIADAKRMTYPHPIDVRIHVLDDGKREPMRLVAEEEGVGYMTRDNNVGFKAGNMRNGLEQTHGDFIVICDADTRPFPTFLEHTLPYFRDHDVAWVQTPQWFFDVPEGERLPDFLGRKLGAPARWLGRAIEKVIGPVTLGEDPFENDPQMFYDVIQRRRNWANASFCCGAGSVHRREAIMEAALKEFAEAVNAPVEKVAHAIEDEELRRDFETAMRRQVAGEVELTPYKFHVSEDIYTSMVLHGDPSRNWKSVFHPHVESKMLSPQDLQTWVVQRFKYAGGTLDITLHDNPLVRSGMDWKQKLMYGATMWSYLGGLWNVIFLFAPIVFFFTAIPPVSTYSFEFMKHIVPFLIVNELAFLVGTWGISNYRGKSSYLAFFPLNLRAIWTVLKGEQIKFPTTPKERQTGNFSQLVQPQMLVILLTFAGVIVYGSALARGQVSNMSGFFVNTFWALNNVLAMSRIVRAAYWQPLEEEAA